MTRIDQFESVFKAAARDVYEPHHHDIKNVLLVSDLPEKDAWLYAAGIKRFLAAVDPDGAVHWASAHEDRGRTVGELLEVVEQEKPDLICTYRSLYSEGWRWPFSLGEHLDVLTQAVDTPVLVMPRPDQSSYWQQEPAGTARVMAMTDHLDGDDRLVDWAVQCTAAAGTLFLAHIEDERTFRRYLDDVIAKIPEIDTDLAEDLIGRRLLKGPADYIESVGEALREAGLKIQIESLVSFGRHLKTVEDMVTDKAVDLVVMETKDDDQLAMHGLAYPLAVELRSVPLLMI